MLDITGIPLCLNHKLFKVINHVITSHCFMQFKHFKSEDSVRLLSILFVKLVYTFPSFLSPLCPETYLEGSSLVLRNSSKELSV